MERPYEEGRKIQVVHPSFEQLVVSGVDMSGYLERCMHEGEQAQVTLGQTIACSVCGTVYIALSDLPARHVGE